MIAPRNFTNDLRASFDAAPQDAALLARAFHVAPADIEKAGYVLDKSGVDYLVHTPRGAYTVDVKRRGRGAAHHWRSIADPDCAVERWSKYEYGVPGALFRDSPLPDYWAFVYSDLPSRIDVVPAELLRIAARANYEQWAAEYGQRPSVTMTREYGPYSTIWVPVPLSIVATSLSTLPGLGLWPPHQTIMVRACSLTVPPVMSQLSTARPHAIVDLFPCARCGGWSDGGQHGSDA